MENQTPTPNEQITSAVPINQPKQTNKIPSYFYFSLIILSVAILILVYTLSINAQNKKQPITSPTVTESQPTASIEQFIPTTAPISPPPGYVIKDTLCYSLYIPQKNKVDPANNCDQYLNTEQDYPFFIKIAPIYEYKDYKNVQEIEQGQPDYGYKKISSENIKVGGMDAIKVTTESVKDTVYPVFIYVYTQKKYNINGILTNGFEITTTFGTADIKPKQEADLNIALSTWTWK